MKKKKLNKKQLRILNKLLEHTIKQNLLRRDLNHKMLFEKS